MERIRLEQHAPSKFRVNRGQVFTIFILGRRYFISFSFFISHSLFGNFSSPAVCTNFHVQTSCFLRYKCHCFFLRLILFFSCHPPNIPLHRLFSFSHSLTDCLHCLHFIFSVQSLIFSWAFLLLHCRILPFSPAPIDDSCRCRNHCMEAAALALCRTMPSGGRFLHECDMERN